MKKTVPVWVAASLLALAAGCTVLENGPGWMPEPDGDAAIAAAAMDGLSRDGMTAQANLCVTVENGLATLTGVVPDRAVRQRAVQILGNTPGIFEVRDHTRIF